MEGILKYLNRKIRGLNPEQLERKYAQLTATHRDIIHLRYKFQNRETPTEDYAYFPREHYSDWIKYESVSIFSFIERFIGTKFNHRFFIP